MASVSTAFNNLIQLTVVDTPAQHFLHKPTACLGTSATVVLQPGLLTEDDYSLWKSRNTRQSTSPLQRDVQWKNTMAVKAPQHQITIRGNGILVHTTKCKQCDFNEMKYPPSLLGSRAKNLSKRPTL